MRAQRTDSHKERFANIYKVADASLNRPPLPLSAASPPNSRRTGMDLKEAAQTKFGNDRAEELTNDLEQLADDIRKLRSIPIEPEDEP